ncbi:hypothetical protein GCM10007100_38210 [Roseibacillus persicicus]|uniref:Uncharacterized protein n=1 Tax=Roseibacillus persicicus TaxID=454148 RepID=A0A918TZU5_9BACT|nr:hypothetical protein GCM10007100_38210 [Roseibacillus persicicus]
MSARLNLRNPLLEEAFKKAQRGLGNGRVDFEHLERQRDFHVTLLQLEKEEAISHHTPKIFREDRHSFCYSSLSTADQKSGQGECKQERG